MSSAPPPQKRSRLSTIVGWLGQLVHLVALVVVFVLRLSTIKRPDPKDKRTETLLYYPLMTFTLLYFLCWLALCMYAASSTWARWWPYPELGISATELDDARPATYAVIGGAVGGTLYSFRGFARGVVREQQDLVKHTRDSLWHPWNESWTIYNISRPVVAAVLAAVVYGVITGGIATLGAEPDVLGPAAHFAIGSLAGFGATDAFLWMEHTAKERFKV